MQLAQAETGFIRVAVVSPELQVASAEFNTHKIIEACRKCYTGNANIIVFPELSITGYTCGDLFYQSRLLKECEDSVNKLKLLSAEVQSAILIGAPVLCSGKLFNCAIFISGGEICGIVPKTYLPNTNEYYEQRWFSSEHDRITDTIEFCGDTVPFGADLLFECSSLKELVVGIEICEDLWSVIPPSSDMALAGANLLCNLSAGDELLGKHQYRKSLVANQSGRCLAAYAYSGAGPNESSTDMVFGGHLMIAENGVILAENKRFSFDTDILMCDIDIKKLEHERLKNSSYSIAKPNGLYRKIQFDLSFKAHSDIIRPLSRTPFVPTDAEQRSASCREIFKIQTTGLIKRLRHLDCKNVVIGVSGGLDSTLALLAAYRAFKEQGWDSLGIKAITMPGPGTTNKTRTNAEYLSKLLGTGFEVIDITKAVDQHFQDIGHDPASFDVVYENTQARERTQILMDKANQCNGIVIGTGDLSELALGWSTYNGDHMSMYGINAGVPKTLVKYIIQWYADETEDKNISKVLNDIINTPISPELLPADNNNDIVQKTEELIGPYILHDFFLYYAIRLGYSPSKILFTALQAFENDFTCDEIAGTLKVFYKRFFAQQFKRSCLPDSVKVGSLALSPRGDWRMPSDAVCALWLKELENIPKDT